MIAHIDLVEWTDISSVLQPTPTLTLLHFDSLIPKFQLFFS